MDQWKKKKRALAINDISGFTGQKKDTVHQVTTTLATSKIVWFPSPNHLLTTGTDDPLLAGVWAIIKVLGDQHCWLAGGYDLEIGHV